MILTKRFSCTFVLFLLTLALCCVADGAVAARIAKKSTAATTTTTSESSIANTTNTELSAEANANASSEEDDEEEEDEKTAVAANDTSSLGIWGMMRGLWNWLRDDISESLLGDDDGTKTTAVEGRTFGKIRRLQMALIPIIFKFGILSAMVFFLVLLGLKTFFLLKLLVLMNAVAILAKFLTFKTHLGGGGGGHYEHSAPAWGGAYSNGWSPHSGIGGWGASAPAAPEPHHPTKEIHLHIHGAQPHPQVGAYTSYGNSAQVVQQQPQPQQHHGGWERRNDPYAAYEPAPAASESEMDMETNSSAGLIGILPTLLAPANHRAY